MLLRGPNENWGTLVQPLMFIKTEAETNQLVEHSEWVYNALDVENAYLKRIAACFMLPSSSRDIPQKGWWKTHSWSALVGRKIQIL